MQNSIQEIERAMSSEASTSRSSARQSSERRTTSRVQDSIITIRAIPQDNRSQIINYKMKKSSQLAKLMTAYCNRTHMDPNVAVFLFEGRRLNKEQTPAEVGIEDGDEIDVMDHLTGGEGGGFIMFN